MCDIKLYTTNQLGDIEKHIFAILIKERKMKIIFALFFLLNLGWSIFVSAFPPPDERAKPCVILRDSYDREIPCGNPLGFSDSVFGSFFNLEANKEYKLSIMRGGKEISNLCLRSDKEGVISTCALWWDIGLNYDHNKCQKNIEEHTYCLSERDNCNDPVIKITIRGEKREKFIYTCDKKGNPQNTFICNKDDVYLTAQNSAWPKDAKDKKVYIYVVKDRWSWIPGDKLDDKDFLMQKHVAVLSDRGLLLPHLVWNKDDLEVGSYDIIVSYRNLGILVNNDLIDSNYGVGFKIIEEQRKKYSGDIIQELACQAPPHSLCRGNLEQPHRAIYKDYFSPIEEVWVAFETLNPTPAQREAKKVRIYVIQHQAGSPLKDGDQLQDVSGGYEEVLLQPDLAHAVFTRVWCNPKIREEGYDVVIDFKNSRGIFGTYDKGLDILDNGMKKGCEGRIKGKHRVNCFEVDHMGFYVPEKWVCLESVTFNYTNALISDAITMKDNLRPEEWRRGEKSFPATYVKNSPITLKPKFIASKEIKEARFEAYTNYGNLGNVIKRDIYFNNQQEKKPDNRTCPIVYNVSCYHESKKGQLLQVRHNTPDRIQSFYQQWDWYLNGIESPYDEEIHIGSTINKIYIVLSAPQYPWTSSGDSAPWPDVLDLFCQVAYDESEPESAAEKITQFLYEGVGAIYDRSAYPYSKRNDPYSDFLVKKFFDKIPEVGKLNCYDMGKALVTFGNILGCNLTLRYCKPFGQLNCVRPVGSCWMCEMCGQCNDCFKNHAFTSIGDNVFDASLKADSWGNPALPPYRDAWMINITWCEYKEMVVKKECWPRIPYPQIVLFKLDTKTQN